MTSNIFSMAPRSPTSNFCFPSTWHAKEFRRQMLARWTKAPSSEVCSEIMKSSIFTSFSYSNFTSWGSSNWQRIKQLLRTTTVSCLCAYITLRRVDKIFRFIFKFMALLIFNWNQYKINHHYYSYRRNGSLLSKLFWPTVRINCSSVREKLLKVEVECREFAKILRSLEQFIQAVKGQNNFEFLVTECFFKMFLEVSQI